MLDVLTLVMRHMLNWFVNRYVFYTYFLFISLLLKFTVNVKAGIADLVTPLREYVYQRGSHSVTCHQTDVNIPRPYPTTMLLLAVT